MRPVAPMCPGSNDLFTDTERYIDGAGVTHCGTCHRHVVAEEQTPGLYSPRAHWPLRSRIVHSRDEDGVPEDMDEVTW